MGSDSKKAGGMPDKKISVRKVFNIDSDMEVPAYSESNEYVPEFDITYFFTKNIAAELILGTTPHTAKGKGKAKSPS